MSYDTSDGAPFYQPKAKRGRKLGAPNRQIHYETPLSEALGSLIIACRTEKDMRQEDVANKAGIAESTVRKMERGEGSINMQFAQYVLNVLGWEIAFQPKKGNR